MLQRGAAHHVESPHLALWRSCVAQVVERAGARAEAAGDALLRGVAAYTEAMMHGTPPRAPDSDDEEAVHAYLSFLHHQRAHARIAGDAAIEASVEKQLSEYKFGNPLWEQMFEEYFAYYWSYPYHEGRSPAYRSWKAADAGRGDLDYARIEWRLPSDARIAILGDVGTGTDEAAAVLVAAIRARPDAILHLGDVYYSGTRAEMDARYVGLLKDVMESEEHDVPVFGVPGNHEYFTGAIPYLEMLDSMRLARTPRQRQRASYFSLRTEDDGWQFLGLDTGYHGHYMNVPPAAQQAALAHLHVGPVVAPGEGVDSHWPRDRNPYLPVADTTAPVPMVTLREDELEWHHDKLAGFPGRTILLSHHPLYSALNTCGVPQAVAADGRPDPASFDRPWINTGLWRQFGPYFGDRVAAWIWGHEHNLGIFADGYRPADWPTDGPDARDVFKTLPLGRCSGHAAIPVMEAEAPYAEKYPVPLKRPDLKLGVTDGRYHHGFEILQLAGAGRPARLDYYQVAGIDPKPSLLFSEEVA